MSVVTQEKPPSRYGNQSENRASGRPERPSSANYRHRRPKTSMGFVNDSGFDENEETDMKSQRPKSARGNRSRQPVYTSIDFETSSDNDEDVFDVVDYDDDHNGKPSKGNKAIANYFHDRNESTLCTSSHSNGTNTSKQNQRLKDDLENKGCNLKNHAGLATMSQRRISERSEFADKNENFRKILQPQRSRSLSATETESLNGLKIKNEEYVSKKWHVPSETLLKPAADKLIEKYRSRITSNSSEDSDAYSMSREREVRRPPPVPRKLRPLTKSQRHSTHSNKHNVERIDKSTEEFTAYNHIIVSHKSSNGFAKELLRNNERNAGSDKALITCERNDKTYENQNLSDSDLEDAELPTYLKRRSGKISENYSKPLQTDSDYSSRSKPLNTVRRQRLLRPLADIDAINSVQEINSDMDGRHSRQENNNSRQKERSNSSFSEIGKMENEESGGHRPRKPRSMKQLRRCSTDEIEELKRGGSLKSRPKVVEKNEKPQLAKDLERVKECRYLRNSSFGDESSD